MKSMTGFGYMEYQDEKYHISITLKSYNNRFLDIFVYLPPHLIPLEQRFREHLSNRILRGRVELYLKTLMFEENPSVVLDISFVRPYVRALRELAEAAGINEKVRLSHLLKIEGILKTDRNQNLEEYWQILEPILDSSFQSFERMRLQEGENTREDISKLLSIIDSEISMIEGKASQVEAKIKEGLKSRFYELLGDGIDETRILAETAVLLMKYDINEELVRIRSHLNNFSSIMEDNSPLAVGKKLDFICQELNREINTIGSKSMLLEVNSSVVSLKDSLEKIREQLRNVE